jgi:hypothetical protein
MVAIRVRRDQGGAGGAGDPGFSFDDPDTAAGRTDENSSGGDEYSAAIGAAGSDEPIRRRRGRRPGSKNKKKSLDVEAQTSFYKTALLDMHSMIAMVTVPAAMLPEAKAQLLAERLAWVEYYYPNLNPLSEGRRAILALLVAAVYVEGPVALALLAHARAPKRKPVTAPPAQQQARPMAVETPVQPWAFSGMDHAPTQ